MEDLLSRHVQRQLLGFVQRSLQQMGLNLIFQLLLRFAWPESIDIIQYKCYIFGCFLSEMRFNLIVGISQTDGNLNLMQNVPTVEDSLADFNVTHPRNAVPIRNCMEDRSTSPILRQQGWMYNDQPFRKMPNQPRRKHISIRTDYSKSWSIQRPDKTAPFLCSFFTIVLTCDGRTPIHPMLHAVILHFVETFTLPMRTLRNNPQIGKVLMQHFKRRAGHATRTKEKKAVSWSHGEAAEDSVGQVHSNDIIATLMNSEGSQYPQEIQCDKCGERGDNRIHLSCRHKYCLGCAAFSYHKFKLAMSKPTLTRCFKCDRINEFSEEELRAITDFTDQVLMPLMREEEDNRSAKSRHETHPIAYSELSSGNKQFKSHEHSVEKVTPIGRGFYSKCESPKSGLNQQYCSVHPEQQLNIVCLSCQNTLLCISCIANKRHSNHNIKTIAKGIENVQEQIALARLKGKEQVECLEMLKRRLDDRRSVIQERWDRTTESLRLHFSNLMDLIQKKSEETVSSCGEFYQKIMEDVVRDGAKVEEIVKLTKKQLTKLTDLSKSSANSIDLIRKSTVLIEELKESREPEVETGDIPNCDSDRLIRQLMRVSEQMERLEIISHREWRQGIEGSRSQEKLLKENFCKRVKTNMMSLNSSRDKKEKKCTKTEEDEKRNKSKANYKTQSSSKLLKVNKAIPAYLLQQDRFNKDSHLPDCLIDHNPLQSSFKSTSKVLSKSHLPSGTEQLRKKQQHRTQIKQRLQRKTFNGQSKQMRGTADGMRKKKIPC